EDTLRGSSSKTEKEQQINSRPFDAAEGRSVAEGLRIGIGRAQPQDARDRVLDRRLVVWLRSELTAEARDDPRRDLLTHGKLRSKSVVAAGFQLEDVEPNLLLHRAQDLTGEKPCGKRPGAHQQLLLLRRAELVHRRAADDLRK